MLKRVKSANKIDLLPSSNHSGILVQIMLQYNHIIHIVQK